MLYSGRTWVWVSAEPGGGQWVGGRGEQGARNHPAALGSAGPARVPGETGPSKWGEASGLSRLVSLLWGDPGTGKGSCSSPICREWGTGPRIRGQIPHLLCDFGPGWACFLICPVVVRSRGHDVLLDVARMVASPGHLQGAGVRGGAVVDGPPLLGPPQSSVAL